MNTESPQSYDEILQYYREQLKQEEAIANRCATQWNGVGIIRGLLLLLALASFILGFPDAWGLGVLWWVIAGVAFVGFIVVAYYHEGMAGKLRRSMLLSRMHTESIARQERDWDNIRVPEIEIPKEFRPISKDLDLLGTSSLYKLLGVTRTPLGTETLRLWIIEGALSDEIKLRQDAVAELTDQFAWRLRFRLLCEQLQSTHSGPNRFIEWCESPNWFDQGNRWVLYLSRLTSIGSLVALPALIFGILPLTIGGPILIVASVINFALSVFYAGTIHEIFNRVSSRSDEANHYVSLFDMVSEFPAESEKLKQLQSGLKAAENGAQESIKKLGFCAWLANIRRQGFMFLVYMVFEFLFFWDVHALDLLERWKTQSGARARKWFEDLGQWEALCALAKLAGDHPDWNFPKVEPAASAKEAVVVGKQVGHPLLDRSRVCNDVQMGPPGTVLLVTGSNMSGKSTLLRSVGANIVLAQMGSVVCAESLKMPPLHIETSMRIDDSLADGVSFFMAELKRLKEIVDTAKQHEQDNPRRMLFLLDEILQGTNSRERQIAVSRVVRKLIDENAIGAISTHDLDLATTDELAKACQTVHFSEQFREVNGKKEMTFDYQMKSGIAETTNALKLLEIVGLGDEE